MPSYPEVTLGDVNAPRKADMFALFGPPMDFQVYYGAGKTLAEGGSVYDQCVMTSNWGQGWCLPFTYPPFAAWLASLYSKLSFEGAVFIWQTMSLLIFAVVLGAIIFERASRLSLGKIAFLIILLVATFAFSPARSSFYWGQVNMLIVGLVAVDFLRAERWASVRENGWRDDRWYAGIVVGLAAAIKVSPAFFGLMFLLQKRWRAAIVSGVTFFITVVLGFLMVPEAGKFWVDTLTDTSRFSGMDNVTSQSIQIALQREFGIDSTLLWALLAVLVTVLTSLGAWYCLRAGNRAVALSIVGIAACIISPFSWHHYYLWVITLSVAAGVIFVDVLRNYLRDTLAFPLGALIGFAGGAAIAATCVVALWPYVSIVFFYSFDVYHLARSSNPFVASVTVWWSLLLIALTTVVAWRVLNAQARLAQSRSELPDVGHIRARHSAE